MGPWCCRRLWRRRAGDGCVSREQVAARLQLRSFAALRATQDDSFKVWALFLKVVPLAAGAGGFGFGDEADDGAFAGGAGLAVVADEKVFDDFIDAGVLEASEFGVLIKRNIARAPDEAQTAEDSAGFTLEGL